MRLLLSAALVVIVLAVARWYVATRSPESQPATAPPGELSGSLLDQVQGSGQTSAGAAAAAPSDAELEAAFAEISRLRTAAGQAAQRDNQAATTLDEQLASLQEDLRRARDARPGAPVVEWLTGELLMVVGGEPGEVRPWLERAAAAGLQRPQVLVSLARMQIASNQFEAGYQSIGKALDANPDDEAAWQIFSRDAYTLLRFDEVLQRIERRWPADPPAWAEAIRQRTQVYRDQWAMEARVRAAEAKADDLPRVRLTIEHQAFDQGGDSRAAATAKTTGRDEVEIELFENQAPATVANFVDLVERGFYTGTRFHWTEAAGITAGGDPNTRNADPADDGAGGPGYVIADEFAKPGARPHLRGSVSMLEQSPGTAGSQFFIELIPHPQMDGHVTVFGRVIRGLEGVDRMTPGRTNLKIGGYGKIIPGDLVVRAEVIRKRGHSYRAGRVAPR
jgi:cyclophilin family peptidyl-prolyl cis-trans isomerase